MFSDWLVVVVWCVCCCFIVVLLCVFASVVWFVTCLWCWWLMHSVDLFRVFCFGWVVLFVSLVVIFGLLHWWCFACYF